jgi:ribosomal protein S13
MNVDYNNLVDSKLANVDEVIHHLANNIKTKIAVSKIDGVGVIAIRNIKKGEDIVPNERLSEIPNEVLDLLHKYFINEECGYKIFRLFKGLNFLHHGTSYCNSAYKTEYTRNISDDGIALIDINAGDEILESYNENIN